MDFENTNNNNNSSYPPPPPPPPPPSQQPPVPPVVNVPPAGGGQIPPNRPVNPNMPPRGYAMNYQQPKKKSGWRIFWGIVLVLSLLGNAFLFIMLIGVAAIGMSGGALMTPPDSIVEHIIEKGAGPGGAKIAVINLVGIIESNASADVRMQLKRAASDDYVKGVILRTITPGGTVSASDQIHHEISKFRKESGKPVVAFMQSVAASGGYYTSVACDEIIAEPTTITGSIGVIMNNMVLKELLEDKLGIEHVTLKSGQKKDWPSMFSETTEEQKTYLMEKMITPAYDRFVDLVAEGRSKHLTREQVVPLADGSIYGAQEALDVKLIDHIGYQDEAIALIRKLAFAPNARVVEYRKPVSLSSLLGVEAKPSLKFDRKTLEELTVPRLMYLWNGQ